MNITEKSTKVSGKPLRIDVHVHMVSTNEETGSYLRNGALGQRSLRTLADARFKRPGFKNFLTKNFDRWYAGNLTRKIRESKRIDKAVLLAFDEAYTPDGERDEKCSLAFMPNDYIHQIVASNSSELLFGASVNPYRRDALDELHRCKEMGAVLNKWVPNSQNIDPGDKRIAGFYDKMAELRLPLLSHTGYEHALRTWDQSFGDARRLALPLERGVTVIAGHAGSSGTDAAIEYFDFFLAMLKEFPNLYGDLAALTWANRKPYLMRMVREPALFDRMVQGTDYPVPVVPAMFANEIGIAHSVAMQFGNYFDVEAELKLRLGVPEAVFTRSFSLLPI